MSSTQPQDNPAVDVLKGNPTDLQRRALEIFIDQLAEQAEEQRREKPDTRGWYGSPTEPFPNRPEANPAGFRTPRLPRG